VKNALAFLLGCVALIVGVAMLVQTNYSLVIGLFWVVVGASLIVLSVTQEIRRNWK
jgi:hypothetical protein